MSIAHDDLMWMGEVLLEDSSCLLTPANMQGEQQRGSPESEQNTHFLKTIDKTLFLLMPCSQVLLVGVLMVSEQT